MKIPLALSAAILLAACADIAVQPELDPLTIRYSGTFKLELPALAAAGASILYADGPSLRLQGGEVISSMIVTRDLEALPENFNLALYPRYLFGLDADPALLPDLQRSFAQSLPALGLGEKPEITVSERSDAHFYSACGDNQRCVTFVVSPGQKHHILMLSTESLSAAVLIDMVGVN